MTLVRMFQAHPRHTIIFPLIGGTIVVLVVGVGGEIILRFNGHHPWKYERT